MSFTIGQLVDSVDRNWKKRQYEYEFSNGRKFFGGGYSGLGIDFMDVEGTQGEQHAFIVAPDGLRGAELFRWIKEHQ